MSSRGRGKKVTTVGPPAAASADGVEEKPKKTSKKKQFPVVAVVTPDGIEGNLLPEIRRPLIVHLPIQSKDVVFNDDSDVCGPLRLPPCIPEPYDSTVDNPYMEGQFVYETVNEPTESNTNSLHDTRDRINKNEVSTTGVAAVTSSSQNDTNIDYYNMKGTLLVQYKESIELKTIPHKSDSACLWCCHQFANRPVVLPLKDQGEYLQVFGNFCCPECAAAYLFDMRQDSHTRWEQLAILYRVYGEACGGKIHPAPARTTLCLFGGTLSIDEYRSLIRSQKVRIDVHLPPMVSLLSTMDTKPIDFYDTNLTMNVVETVKERLQKAEEVLRLRRTKPLKAWESTLDACINLKVKHEDDAIKRGVVNDVIGALMA